jgi:hypothetical protein
MPVVVLNADVVNANGTAVKVGADPVWADGSDATYMELVANTGSAWAELDVLTVDPSRVTAIAYRVRTWASEPIENFQFQFEWSGRFFSRIADDDLPAGFYDLLYTFTDSDYSDYGVTIATIADRLTGYTEFEALFQSQAGTVRVLEAQVEVTYTGGTPPLRLMNRDDIDGAGGGPALRLWPRPSSRQGMFRLNGYL